MKKTKKKRKSTTGKTRRNAAGLVQKYVNTDTKYKPLPALAKTGIDLVVATAGGALGAAFGYASAGAGLLVTFGGHILGDKTGLLKTLGLSALVFGFAKGYENSQAASQSSMNGISLGSITEGVKERMVDFKDNLIHAIYLGKLLKSKKEEGGEIGSLNLDELDVFDDFADKQQYRQAMIEEQHQEVFDDMQINSPEVESFEEDDEQYADYEELAPAEIDFDSM